jgi:hypothetical protein
MVLVILLFCFITPTLIASDITIAIELMRSPKTETATEIKSKIENIGKEKLENIIIKKQTDILYNILLLFFTILMALTPSLATGRSLKNTFRKRLIYLLLMVIALPSIGLTSLRGIYRDYHCRSERHVCFQLVFIPDRGAF